MTGRGDPADYGGKSARRAADDDVLRGGPLQPHRIDGDVEDDGKGEHRGGQKIGGKPHDGDRGHREHDPEAERIARRNPPRRDGTAPGAPHQRIDIAVIPHVDRSRRAGADGDGEDGGKGEHRVEGDGRDEEADRSGEDDQSHHPRLEQGEPVAYAREREGGGLPLPRLGDRLESGLAHRNALTMPVSADVVSGSGAVPRRYGTAAASSPSTPAWSPLRPSNWRAAALCW